MSEGIDLEEARRDVLSGVSDRLDRLRRAVPQIRSVGAGEANGFYGFFLMTDP